MPTAEELVAAVRACPEYAACRVEHPARLHDFATRRDIVLPVAVFNRRREPVLVAAAGRGRLALRGRYPTIARYVDLADDAAPVLECATLRWRPFAEVFPAADGAAVRRPAVLFWWMLAGLAATGVLAVLAAHC